MSKLDNINLIHDILEDFRNKFCSQYDAEKAIKERIKDLLDKVIGEDDFDKSKHDEINNWVGKINNNQRAEQRQRAKELLEKL